MNRFELFESLYRHRARAANWKVSAIAWAVDALTDGVDTPSLRILAGLPASSYEVDVEEYFALALDELGEPPIGETERCLGVARAFADALLRQEITPRQCADLVHTHAVSPLNHPFGLQPWCDLDSGFISDDDGMVRQLPGPELDRAILDHAKSFLAEHPQTQLARLTADASS